MHEHLSDAELARYATDPDSVPIERQRLIEQEAAHCPICRTSLDFFSVVTAEELANIELRDGEPTWRNQDDAMRAHIERIAAEDREADELLEEKKLLESPTKTAWTNLPRDKRLLSGGIVRRLCAHANKIYESEALDALTFADAAISVAEALPDNTYPWNAVFELRGTAWKERANALKILGEYPAALEALKHAERAYGELQSSGFGLSTVALVRASVLCEQGLLSEAVLWAERAEHGFAHLGQEERRTRAVFLRGTIKFNSGDPGSAIELFKRVLDYGVTYTDARWVGQALYAIANCEVDRRNLAEASLQFHKALMIFREIGEVRHRMLADWGMARVVLHSGRLSEAITRLRPVGAELEGRSMLTEAALVRLDIVEALLGLGQTKQIVDICARLFETFKNAGMMTGALTAIAYMREAAAAGRLTTDGVNTVREYLRRAERQPELAFAPPPEPSR